MPVTPITTDLSTIFASLPVATIKTASSLAGPWTTRANLYLDSLRDTVAPAIGQAKFTYHYGKILQPGGTTYGTVTPIDIEGLYVWINQTHDDVDIEDPDDWYGIVEVDERTPHGAVDGVSSGIQQLTAYSIERIAEKYIMATATIENSAGSAIIEITQGLSFNADSRGEMSGHGNRSTNTYAGDGDEPDAYVFSYQERGQAQWSAEDAVNYLLTHVAPKMLPDVHWYLDVASGNLDWNPRGNVGTDRQTFKSVLDALISRQRGVGYYFAFSPDEVKPAITVTVFSYSDSDITMPDGSQFDENPNQFSIDFEQAFDITNCKLTNTKTSQFNRVIIEGAHRTSTCSLRVDDESAELVPDWIAADETDFAAGASAEAWYAALNREDKNRANKTSRSDDKFAAVYRRFRVSNAWSLTSVDPLTPAMQTPVFPALETEIGGGFVDPAEDDPTWIEGLKLLDRLPLRERYDYSDTHIGDDDWTTTADVDNEPPFLQPFTFMQTNVPKTDDWQLLDKVDGDVQEKPGKRKWSINTKPEQDRAAIVLDVTNGPQQFFAKTDFAASTPAVYDKDDDPSAHYGLDWSDAWVTLTLEHHERCRIEYPISSPATGEQLRVLRISRPDCRLDYVVPNTVVGVVNGALQQTDGGFVRDDRERLGNEARAAALWYGRTRQTLDLTFKQIRRIVGKGDLIVDVGATYQKTAVNSVVTAITYDRNSITTQWETSYMELDLA